MLALVVDDSRAVRSTLRRMLNKVGFDVVEAGDGLEALDRLHDDDLSPDLALVDWNMPQMDGLDLVKSLRKDRRYAELPVMMVTAETDSQQMVRALMAGADEYAMKPLDQDALVEKLALLGLVPAAS